VSLTDKLMDRIAISISSVAFMSELNAESCFKNIMHLRDRGCVRTLRPLFVYATGLSVTLCIVWKRLNMWNFFHRRIAPLSVTHMP